LVAVDVSIRELSRATKESEKLYRESVDGISEQSGDGKGALAIANEFLAQHRLAMDIFYHVEGRILGLDNVTHNLNGIEILHLAATHIDIDQTHPQGRRQSPSSYDAILEVMAGSLVRNKDTAKSLYDTMDDIARTVSEMKLRNDIRIAKKERGRLQSHFPGSLCQNWYLTRYPDPGDAIFYPLGMGTIDTYKPSHGKIIASVELLADELKFMKRKLEITNIGKSLSPKAVALGNAISSCIGQVEALKGVREEIEISFCTNPEVENFEVLSEQISHFQIRRSDGFRPTESWKHDPGNPEKDPKL
jgi:hypothetical protein